MRNSHDISDLVGGDLEDRDEFASVPALPSVVGTDAPLAVYCDNKLMLEFIRQMRRATPEAMNDAIIGHGYAAVMWKFREAALLGDIDRTRALKMWLEWAQPHIDKPKEDPERISNPNAAAFLPRDVK